MTAEETLNEMSKAVSALQSAIDRQRQTLLSDLELGREVPFFGITFKDGKHYDYQGKVSIKGAIMSLHFPYPNRGLAISAARRLLDFEDTEK